MKLNTYPTVNPIEIIFFNFLYCGINPLLVKPCTFLHLYIVRHTSNKLPFLGMFITKPDVGRLQNQVFRKPTHRDQILNFLKGNQFSTHKMGCIQTLNPVKYCSSAAFKKAEWNKLHSIFDKNIYLQL